MGDDGGFLGKIRGSIAYGPAGMVGAAAVWSGLRYGMSKVRLPDADQIANCILALLLSGVYVYSWTQGNPHDGEIKQNELVYEIALLFAGGFYLVYIYPKSVMTSLQYLLCIVGIVGVLVAKSGANVASTLGFLVECPSFAFTLLGVLKSKELGEGVLSAAGLVHALAFAFARVLAAGYTVYTVVSKADADNVLKVIAVLVYLSSLLNAGNAISSLQGGEERCKKRSRSPCVFRSKPPRRYIKC